MDVYIILHAVGMMGVLMGIGALLSKKIRFQEDTKQLFISLIVSVAVPGMILHSFTQLTIEKSFYLTLSFVFLFSIGLYLFAVVLGMVIVRLCKGSVQKVKEIGITSALANTGFIGIPLTASLLGPKATLLAVVFDMGVGISVWTIGVLVLQKHRTFSWKALKQLLNMPLIAFAIGLTCNLFGISWMGGAEQLFERLGMLATPLAMIYIGFYIPRLLKKRKQVKAFLLVVAGSIRLFLMPIIATIVLWVLRLDLELTQVIFLMSLMPVGTMTPILFAKCGADEEFGASATVYTTLFSLLTIPVMVYMCQGLIRLN